MGNSYMLHEQQIEHGDISIKVAIWDGVGIAIHAPGVSVILNPKPEKTVDIDTREGHGGDGEPLKRIILNGQSVPLKK